MENTTPKKKPLARCSGSCPGIPRREAITRVFRRKGSRVEVIVEGIPADVCPICARVFVSRPVAHDIDRILLPFHGQHTSVPELPPARVFIDFRTARRAAA